MTALIVLRDKAIKSLLAAAQGVLPAHGGQNPTALETHSHTIRIAMHGVFSRLGIVARTATIIFSLPDLKGLTPRHLR